VGKTPKGANRDSALQYRSEIDGLRTVAILPVMLFHAGFGLFQGGYVGVDVFFVISGFLITQTIAEEMERGRFTLTSFYERRARRILPALFVMLAVSAPWLTFCPTRWSFGITAPAFWA
jgi:peptidoglycan/LPS O-acetylase OafA/YrhL